MLNILKTGKRLIVSKPVSNVARAACVKNVHFTSLMNSQDVAGPKDINFPNYKERQNEQPENLKARLVYQSRKRGTLEIGLLLSSFASKYLPSMTSEQLHDYDQLINKPGNEWDLYYWIIGSKPTPEEFDTPVMSLLRNFAKNEEKELRITQPALEEKK